MTATRQRDPDVAFGGHRAVARPRCEQYPADVLLVHAGNRIDLPDRAVARFPASRVPAVRASVGRLLDALRPSGVVSVAAAGADLIVLDEAIRRDIHTHVVLPIAMVEFVKQSVVDAGPEWVGLFDAVLGHVCADHGCSVAQGHDDPAAEWYRRAHDQLIRRAEEVAGGTTIVALTIRPPEGDRPPSVSDDFAARAAQLGWLELCIDPRPASGAAVVVS